MGGDIIGTDKGVYDVSTLHGCYSYLIRECNLPGRACEMVNKLYVMANIAELAAENTHSAPAAVDELIEAYRAVVYEEACLHCGKGEAWTVKCPDGTYLCETWGDSDGQANAEEMAEALNCAYKQGYAAARAEIVEEDEE